MGLVGHKVSFQDLMKGQQDEANLILMELDSTMAEKTFLMDPTS